MTIKKISAIGAAALLACGIWAWSFAQAPKHAPSANGAAAVSAQTAAPVNPAANAAPQPAASVNMAAAGQDCAAPARPKPRAKPKIYRPQPLPAPVAAAPPPPIYSQPVYSPPVLVMPPPVVVGGVAPYYGYGGYPIAGLSYYGPRAPRYWAYGGPRLAYGGSYGRWPHGHRR